MSNKLTTDEILSILPEEFELIKKSYVTDYFYHFDHGLLHAENYVGIKGDGILRLGIYYDDNNTLNFELVTHTSIINKQFSSKEAGVEYVKDISNLLSSKYLSNPSATFELEGMFHGYDTETRKRIAITTDGDIITESIEDLTAPVFRDVSFEEHPENLQAIIQSSNMIDEKILYYVYNNCLLIVQNGPELSTTEAGGGEPTNGIVPILKEDGAKDVIIDLLDDNRSTEILHSTDKVNSQIMSNYI